MFLLIEYFLKILFVISHYKLMGLGKEIGNVKISSVTWLLLVILKYII